MNKLLVLSSLMISSICCFSFMKHDAKHTDTPPLIILRDTNRNVILEVSHNGSVWEVSNGNAAAYLETIAESLQKEIVSISNIQLGFDSLYTKGFLFGIGVDGTGVRVPIGVQYIKSSGTSSIFMDNTEEHTCTGAPCTCCDFITISIVGGQIIGCKCNTYPPQCEGTSCNHTIKAIIKN